MLPLAQKKVNGDSHPTRSAVRFPLQIPVDIQTDEGHFAAVTEDVSSTGVLFRMERAPTINTRISWTLRLPGEMMGSVDDVTVYCEGRVVWQGPSENGRQVGVVIDNYAIGDRPHG